MTTLPWPLVNDVPRGHVVASESTGAQGVCLLAAEDLYAGDYIAFDDEGMAFRT